MEKGILTLCMIHTDNEVLLGMKKRGFGEGRWNGFGGKVEVDEDISLSLCREIYEEACLVVDTSALKQRGIVEFHYPAIGKIHEVHIFTATDFSGEPKETEEMKPQWFAFNEIPFDSMWPDDQYWLLPVLQGNYVEGMFVFDEQNVITSQNFSLT